MLVNSLPAFKKNIAIYFWKKTIIFTILHHYKNNEYSLAEILQSPEECQEEVKNHL